MKEKIFRSIIISFLFFMYSDSEIKAHNTYNGGCLNHCKELKNKKNIYKNNSNSCLNNSKCRG